MASESAEDSIWMDNLEEWVGDQNEVVTVKSLSRGLKVCRLHPSAETARYMDRCMHLGMYLTGLALNGHYSLAFSIGLLPQVHVNVAKEMLFAFAERKKEELELEVVYLVSGERGVRIARADKVRHVGFSSLNFYD